MKNNNAQYDLPALMPQEPVNIYPNDMQPVPYPAQLDRLEGMYPQVYHDVYPLVADAANKLIAAGITPTSEMMNTMVDNIIRNSGMWYEDEDEDGDPFDRNQEAMPVQFGFGRSPFRRRRRGPHNRNTLRDIIRILLLNELFRRNGRF